MALCRLNIPSLMIYGGSIMRDSSRDTTSRFKTCPGRSARHAAGTMTNAELRDLEDHACRAPVPAAAGSLPTPRPSPSNFSASRRWAENGVPAMDQRKDDVAFECGKRSWICSRKTFAQADHHAPLHRKCDRGSRDDRWIDECRLYLLAVARERACGSASTISTRSTGMAVAGRSQTWRPIHRGGLVCRRWHNPWSPNV
ncbi:MAG: dihydroxy-acid dehydratase [Nitrospira sp.]|nr:dihydroxy-acid dehydratase [Nitrospira sp.]